MSDFVHLHVHSHYSLLDAVPKIDELVKTAKKRGFSALALTDHGNMYGAIEFYETCLKEEIKPIIGVEAYIAPGSRFDKNPNDRYNHLVLLALNYTGYKNLMKLVSLSHTEGFYYKPRMDKELLRQYHEGLVASTACLGGEIPHFLQSGKYDEAKNAAIIAGVSLGVAAIAAGTGAFLLWDESADTADQRALVVEPGLGSLLLRGTF